MRGIVEACFGLMLMKTWHFELPVRKLLVISKFLVKQVVLKESVSALSDNLLRLL